MCEGWIKLHRKIWDWSFSKDPDYVSVWLYLITNANHKEANFLFNGREIKLKAGQLVTGRKDISRVTGVNESKVQRILKKLEIEQQIEQQTGNKNRVITIANWSFYQAGEHQSEQQVNNNRTTSEQQVNTNKNDNNKNNDKNNAHTRVKDFEKLKDHFEKMRGSPLSEVALAEALDKWDYVIKTKKPKNPADKFIELMDKSIEFMGSPPPSLKLFIHQKQIKL